MVQNLIPNLHDWEITGLEIDRLSNTISVKLWSSENELKTCLSFEKVDYFNSSGWMVQNVILDVIIFEEYTNSDYLEHCFEILNINRSVFNDSKKIIIIEPSVGAELICCCTDFIYKDQ